jgi:hypothetical protein
MGALDRSAHEFASLATAAVGERFDDAMHSILGVFVARGRGDELSPEEFARFRAAVRDGTDMAEFRGFLGLTFTYTMQVRTDVDMVYRVAWRRSAAQFLIDEVGVVPDATATETLDDIDDELREAAPDVDVLPAKDVPPGIPESHWWWRLGAG